jgi:hypothetical protein
MYAMPIPSLELYARKHSEWLLGCAECRLFGGENLGADCLDEQARLLYLVLQRRQMVAVQGQGIDVFVKPRCRLLEKLVSFKKGEEQGPL